MRKVLYIVYYYPPVGGSGVQRGVKFSRYLPEHGWESLILTPHPALLKHPKDASLLDDVPKSQKIYRSFVLDARWLFKLLWGLRLPGIVNWLRYHVFIPDAEILWLPFAKYKLRRIMRENKIDIVFISGPPFSPMLLGKWIKKKYSLPHVIDFRDDWTQGQSRQDIPPPEFFRRRETRLERETLINADHLVVVNKAYKKDFLKLYPDIESNHISVIANGYDESDFAISLPPRKTDPGKLRIVHAGVLFGRRHPAKIWEALISLSRSGKIDPKKISIHVYGHNFSSFVFKGFENDPVIRNIVHLHPYLPHNKMIPVMLQADALWLFSGPGAKSGAELPGKVFEYMRCAKPILAVINPRGVCAEVLNASGLGFIADTEDVGSIANRLLEIYRGWEAGNYNLKADWDHIRSFERKSLTAELAQVLIAHSSAK
jgi:glycosyltransferase involved in cell wall biosynthesis